MGGLPLIYIYQCIYVHIQLYIYVGREAGERETEKEREKEREKDRMIERDNGKERKWDRGWRREKKMKRTRIYASKLDMPPCLTPFWPWNLAKAAAALPLEGPRPLPGPFSWPPDSRASLWPSAGACPTIRQLEWYGKRKTYTFMTFSCLGLLGEMSLLVQD